MASKRLCGNWLFLQTSHSRSPKANHWRKN